MRVVFLTPYSPVPTDSGGALRVFHLLQHLAHRHEVTVLCYGDDVQADQLRRKIPDLRAVRYLPRPYDERYRRVHQLSAVLSRHSFYQRSVVTSGMQQAIDQALSRGKFDVLHTEYSHMGPFRVRSGVRRVLDAHNVEYDVSRRVHRALRNPPRRLHYWLEFLKLRRDELAHCRQQDVLIATSERDSTIFGRDVAGVPRVIVPNGVDTSAFTPAWDEAVQPHSLVFTGMMGYLPNVDAIHWFLDTVFPLILRQVPDAILHVVGKKPLDSLRARASDRVIITGTVPDIRPYVRAASVYVVPLRIGGGTRLKIAEALSMGKAIVTTHVGAEGIDLVDGEHALMADEPERFAEAVLRLFADATLAARLGTSGRALAVRRYDWAVAGEKLDEAYGLIEEQALSPTCRRTFELPTA